MPEWAKSNLAHTWAWIHAEQVAILAEKDKLEKRLQDLDKFAEDFAKSLEIEIIVEGS
ncbi:MAG: hypothetical protein IPJ71_19635 [Bdellovibrionales bacterium]|nr:hypothetical protein [Bdellovibrionales bacterium]